MLVASEKPRTQPDMLLDPVANSSNVFLLLRSETMPTRTRIIK